METDALHGLLEKLGLTEYESKTLASLFRLREAKAPDISREAQVPKTRVYDVLTRLVEKELVIEIQGRPKKYRLLEPDRIFNRLVETKRSELRALEQQAEALKAHLASWQEGSEEAEEKVMKVKDRQDFVRVLAQELKSASSSILGFTELTDRHAALRRALAEAARNNVEVRVLHGAPSEALAELARAGARVRHAPHGIEAFVIDDEKLVLALTDLKKEKPAYHFTIWKSRPMIQALSRHFESAWKSAQKA